jgi:FolB domain-containing protein
LGCSEEEKYNPQALSFDIDIEFVSPPKAIYTDGLNDTCCYFKISENIKLFCQGKRFNLIEKLGFDIYNVVRESLGSEQSNVKNITVKVTKVIAAYTQYLWRKLLCVFCGCRL